MNPHTTAETLSSYLDEQVSLEEARWVAGHLEQCGRCRDRLEGLRRVMEGLQALEPVAPPRGLGLALQQHLARATPPFAQRDRRRVGVTRTLSQPFVLASFGIIIALAVIVLLFLQALEGRQVPGDSKTSPRPAQLRDGTLALVGERTFERLDGGWVESALTSLEIAAARAVPRGELEEKLAAELEPVLDELDGAVTLKIDGEVIRVLN